MEEHWNRSDNLCPPFVTYSDLGALCVSLSLRPLRRHINEDRRIDLIHPCGRVNFQARIPHVSNDHF